MNADFRTYLQFFISESKLIAAFCLLAAVVIALATFVLVPDLGASWRLAIVGLLSLLILLWVALSFAFLNEIKSAGHSEQNWATALMRFFWSLSLALIVFLFLFLFFSEGITVLAIPGEQVRLNSDDFKSRSTVTSVSVASIAEVYRDYIQRTQPQTKNGIYQPHWFQDAEAMRYSLQTDIVTDLLLQTTRTLPKVTRSDVAKKLIMKWLGSRLAVPPRSLKDTQSAFTVVKLNQLYGYEETGQAINHEIVIRSMLTGDFNMLPGKSESLGYGMQLQLLRVTSLPIIDHWSSSEHSVLLFPGVHFENGRYQGVVQGDMPGINLDLPFTQFKFKPVNTAGFIQIDDENRTQAINGLVVKAFAKADTQPDIPLPSDKQNLLGVVNIIEFWVTRGLSGWPLFYLFATWLMTTGAIVVLRIQTHILAGTGSENAGSAPAAS